MKLPLVIGLGSFGNQKIIKIEPAKVYTIDGHIWNFPIAYAYMDRNEAKNFMLKYVDFFFDSIAKEQKEGYKVKVDDEQLCLFTNTDPQNPQ